MASSQRWSVLFSALVLVIAVAACGREESNDLKVKPAPVAKASTEESEIPVFYQQKAEQKVPNFKALKAEEQKELLLRSYHIYLLFQSLEESHQVFLQSWRVVQNSTTVQVPSVFQQLKQILRSQYDEDGFSVVNSNNICDREEIPRLSMKFQKGVLISMNLNIVSCKEDFRRSIFEAILVSGQNYRWNFKPAEFARGLGRFLSLLNAETYCVVTLKDRKFVDQLSCKNLGQDVDTEEHIQFSKFEYSRQLQDELILEGQRKKGVTDVLSSISLHVRRNQDGEYTEEFRQSPESTTTTVPVKAVAVSGDNVAQQAPQDNPEDPSRQNPQTMLSRDQLQHENPDLFIPPENAEVRQGQNHGENHNEEINQESQQIHLEKSTSEKSTSEESTSEESTSEESR
ncbi:MAG: hypothetical protein LW875_09325 [Proteobacteria bacterium]|jgi:hypothetical protein|nr:hypothetical protein [Pseudomonadota bacterium]